MNYVKLGNTGLDVSPICLGAMSFGTAEGWVHNQWALNEEDSRTIIKRALDLGINFFDTANAYAYGHSEEILGRAIKEYANRDEVVIATKVFVPMAHVSLAWLQHKNPVVAPVIGATKLTHLESAVESLSVELTAEEMAYLEEPYVPHPTVGLIPYGGQLLSAQK